MAILELSGVTRDYGEGEGAVHALRGIDLTVEQGEFVAVMGPSGSGKSTLLAIAGALEPPSAGTVRVAGIDLGALDATRSAILRRRGVGIVFQYYNLVPTLSARDNILVPLRLDGRSPDGRFFEELVGALGIGGRLDAMPYELSGGQQQRVAIARALIYRPHLLLADEPTGNLDRESSRDVVDLLAQCHRRFGQTTVIVTHDERVALAAERVVTIEDGRVVGDERRR